MTIEKLNEKNVNIQPKLVFIRKSNGQVILKLKALS